jgi:glycosyltransferase involved in cell wall biosynthesis
LSRAGSLRVAWQVFQAEGARAVYDRTLDRLAEARRQRSFSPAPESWQPEAPIPVLNLISTPPAPRLGGVQAQLLARIEAEAESRPVALLYPAGADWRLEIQEKETRRVVHINGPAPSPIGLEDPSLEEVVRKAAGVTGAEAIHVEGLAGLPLGSLLCLGHRRILSLHDFAAFCPRPHLLERPVLQFCHYSRDLARCGRCLREDWPVEDAFQAERREVAATLLASAAAVVFPSAFLRRTHHDLFPSVPEGTWRVIEPPSSIRPPVLEEAGRKTLRHVAYIGSIHPHKGILLFEEVVRRLEGRGLRWSVYGGGDAGILARLRRLPGVRVRGYYRAGSLPEILRRDGVDLALLLSTWPESFNLVLSETRAAGIPCLAFDHGAIADRVREGGGGLLVPPGSGAAGISTTLEQLLAAGGLPEVPREAIESTPDARSAAALYLGLYRELGLAGSIPTPPSAPRR